MTATERGTALHLAMQYIDFAACGDEACVNREVQRLEKKALLTKEQAAAVDSQKIVRFIESDIGKRVMQSQNVKREFKFSLLCEVEQFYPGMSPPPPPGREADRILFQGVIDCYFEENGELTVLDFKTDHVTPETLEEKTNNYTGQLTAYAKALERITGKHVKERIIYFFTMDKAIPLK